MEAKTQSKLIKWLKDHGYFVIKTKPGPGVPVGTPDVFAVKEGFWCAFEVKASRNAPFQPLQKRKLEKLDAWSFAKVVYPQNYDKIIAELEAME